MSINPASTSTYLPAMVLYEKPNPRSNSDRKSSKIPKEKARLKVLAPDNEATRKSTSYKEDSILERVRKCLDRGRHPTTPEAEAKTSLLMAAKIMSQHNLKEAEIFAKSGTMEDERTQSGESIVEVFRTDGKKANRQTFAGRLGAAIMTFFECNCCTTKTENSVDYVFYGISRNTAAAAMAFEMVYNLISHWAMSKKGVSASYSYSVGVAEGLVELAKRERTIWKETKGHELCLNMKRMKEEYVKSRQFNFQAGRKGPRVRDLGAYGEGRKDSAKINVRAKRLK